MTTIRSKLPIALAVLLATSAAARAREPEPASSPKADFDLVYAKPDGVELKLDLVQPSGEGDRRPAVLVIHGGAWRAGDKAQMRPLLDLFARRGYVAASPQYRFCPKVTFPAQVHDVKAAVRWLKAHVAEYRIDPDRIAAVGFSAGGHLALMLSSTGPADGLEGDVPADAPSSAIRAAVSFAGPTDLGASDIPEATQPLVRDFLGASSKDLGATAAKASPLTYASKGDGAVLIFQGTKDPLVPATQATKFADALTAAGVPGRVELVLGAGHQFAGEEGRRSAEVTFQFLQSALK